MKYLTSMLCAMCLSGCAATEPDAEFAAQVKKQEGVCTSVYTGKNNGIKIAKCLNEADAVYLNTSRYPDLIQLMFAERVALAEKVQAGKMTQAEADVAMAKAFSEAKSDSERRDTASAAVNVAAAQSYNLVPNYGPRTCFNFGNVVSCN